MDSKVAPSLLAADPTQLRKEVEAVKDHADLLHIDVMDGYFVPNLAFSPALVEALSKIIEVPLDVHLMVEKPSNFIEQFIEAGSDILTFHIEANSTPSNLLQRINEKGVNAGLALNPSTPIEAVQPFFPQVDVVLVMGVTPGFSGQSFQRETLSKISALRKIIKKTSTEVKITVDGGVNADIAHEAKKAGADIFAIGSAIFGHSSPRKAIKEIQEKLSTADG